MEMGEAGEEFRRLEIGLDEKEANWHGLGTEGKACIDGREESRFLYVYQRIPCTKADV